MYGGWWDGSAVATSTSSPTTSVQTPELIIVERIDFHKLPTTSRGILLHTHALCMHTE